MVKVQSPQHPRSQHAEKAAPPSGVPLIGMHSKPMHPILSQKGAKVVAVEHLESLQPVED